MENNESVHATDILSLACRICGGRAFEVEVREGVEIDLRTLKPFQQAGYHSAGRYAVYTCSACLRVDLERSKAVGEYWISRLRVYAARLAEDSFRTPFVDGAKATCSCCAAKTSDLIDPLVHANECPVGQVLHSLLQLQKLESQPSPDTPAASARRNHSPAMETELCGLIFDARSLAKDLLFGSDCMICGHSVSKNGVSGHLSSCAAGRILQRLDRMGELVEFTGIAAPLASGAASSLPSKPRGEDALYEGFIERVCASAGAACGPGAEASVQHGTATVVGEPAATRGERETVSPLSSSEPCALPGCAHGDKGGAR